MSCNTQCRPHTICKLVSQLEQRRREQRVERMVFAEELAAAEHQWPAAALALRRCLQPVLADLAALTITPLFSPHPPHLTPEMGMAK